MILDRIAPPARAQPRRSTPSRAPRLLARRYGEKVILSILPLIVCLPLLAGSAGAQGPATGACQLTPGPRRVVVEIIDAETLRLDDGTLLRLVGAMPPFPPRYGDGATQKIQSPINNGARDESETAATRARPLWQQSLRALRRLLRGRSVELAYANVRKDRYGRRLAQVFLLPHALAAGAGSQGELRPGTTDAPSGSAQAPGDIKTFSDQGGWLQAYLIRAGLARAYTLPGVDSCLTALVQYETQAIADGRGLWRSAAFQIRAAHRSSALQRYAATHQVIDGRVLAVGSTRSRFYLNFGRDWRRDFTVGIDKKIARAFAADGLNVADLAGRYVRIRGWIMIRNGPFIEVVDHGQIEVLRQ